MGHSSPARERACRHEQEQPSGHGRGQAVPSCSAHVSAGTSSVLAGADSSRFPRELPEGQSLGSVPHKVVTLLREAVPECSVNVCKFRCNVSFPLKTSSYVTASSYS